MTVWKTAWSFEASTLGYEWQMSSQRFLTIDGASVAAAEWLRVNAINDVTREDCMVRLCRAQVEA